MKPAWKTELKDPKGRSIKHNADDKEVLTLGDIAYDLLMINDSSANLSGGAKLKNAKLAQRIFFQEDAEIDLDEAKIIKDLVGKYASPAAVLAVENLLDPQTKG